MAKYISEVVKNLKLSFCWLSKPHIQNVLQFSSVQFSRSVTSDSLRPHESPHSRAPCPSPTPGVYSNSCPSRRWYHPAISSSVVPFSSCPQSLPASRSFPMSQLFTFVGKVTSLLLNILSRLVITFLPSFPSKEIGSQNLIQLRISVSFAFHKFTDFVSEALGMI